MGNKGIAETTQHIPHPYEDSIAETWISNHKDNFNNGTTITYAMIKKETEELIGTISLMVNKVHVS